MTYLELKDLYIKHGYIKGINKKPKAFTRYIKKHYNIMQVYEVEIVEPCGIFKVIKNDKTKAMALLEKFKNCNVLKSSVIEKNIIIKK